MCLAIPGRVMNLSADGHLALAEISGVRRQINIDLLEGDVDVGDWVLIHVGFAMSKVSASEAEAQLELLTRLGDYEESLEAWQTTSEGEHDP